MSDTLSTYHDRLENSAAGKTARHLEGSANVDFLPTSAWQAIGRGARNRCARCGKARLFIRFLKPVPQCPKCGQDWTYQQADDFPAYVSIFLTGHLMAPFIIALVSMTDLSVAALMTSVASLALILMVGMIQPAKGGVIALQWWFGMHGFKKERHGAMLDEAESQ